MYRKFLLTFITLIVLSCDSKSTKGIPSITKDITIFEVYLKDPSTLDRFSAFVTDTLDLPLEWNKFDLFGDGVVYDEAFFLGNTTLELVALYAGDDSMENDARYSRIIFGVDDVQALSNSIKSNFSHELPWDFVVSSGGEKFTMGVQTTLDSLSDASNVYVTFWEYTRQGFSFDDRSANADSKEELYNKLQQKLDKNALGIIDLKEVHLELTKPVLADWHQLLGPSKNSGWKLENGPLISFSAARSNLGITSITISVSNLETAKSYLNSMGLNYFGENSIQVNRIQDYGLVINFEE